MMLPLHGWPSWRPEFDIADFSGQRGYACWLCTRRIHSVYVMDGIPF
jgi:hypothetical protein